MDSLKNLLIELDQVNKRLEQVKDPDYIERRCKEVFGGKDYAADMMANIEPMLKEFMGGAA